MHFSFNTNNLEENSMDEIKYTNENRLNKRKVDHAIRRTGFDENFIWAVIFHIDVLDSFCTESKTRSGQEWCLSKLFVDTMHLYPIRRFKNQVNEYSDWPVPILPCELFGELSAVFRRNQFYECLHTKDVIDCRVAAVTPTEYQLRVIHKYGSCRILDDLNIKVVMRRNDPGLLLLGKELLQCELIRVSVSEIKKEELEIFVTLSDNAEEHQLCRPELGRISEEHLPAYVLDPPECPSTYANYLKCLLGFQNPILLNNILEGFGIDPRGVYTYYPVCESLKPVGGNLLLKEMNLSLAKHMTSLAQQQLKNEKFSEALESVEKAIKLYPKKDQTQDDEIQFGKLFEIRGKIHSEIGKAKYVVNQNALRDWKRANKMDSSDHCRNKDLAEFLYKVSNRWYKKKQYKQAAELVEAACKLDENNVEAASLSQHLKSVHSDVLPYHSPSHYDKYSVPYLEEQKKNLVTQLKKFNE